MAGPEEILPLFEAVPNDAKRVTKMSEYFFKTIVGSHRLHEQPADLRNPTPFIGVTFQLLASLDVNSTGMKNTGQRLNVV